MRNFIRLNDGFFGTGVARIMGRDERYYPSKKIKEAQQKISYFIREKAKKEILLVTDILDPKYYEKTEFKVAIESFLSRDALRSQDSAAFRVITSQTKEEIREKNPFLFNLASSELVDILLAEERPCNHYVCIDRRTLFLEEQHPTSECGDIYFLEGTFSLGHDFYAPSFEKLASRATPLVS